MTNVGYPGNVDDSNDPILPPWYVPGWDAQHITQDSIPAPANFFNYNQLPNDITYVTLYGNYDDSAGNWIGGYLTFEQSHDLLYGPDADTGQYYRLPKRLVGSIVTPNIIAYNWQGSGRIYLQFGTLPYVQLMATDTVPVQIMEPYNETQESNYVAPTGWGYWVREWFMGGFKYFIQPTISQASEPVDINQLIVPGTLEPNNDFDFGR